MKVRGLMVAVALLAVLGGLSFWSESNRKANEGKPAADAPPRILTVAQDQVKSIRVKMGTENTLLQRADSGKWRIVEPKPLAAQEDSVSPVLTTLSSLNAERLIEEKAANLASYGLNTPSLEITVTQKDGQSHRLLLGEDTPTGSSVFAKLDNDPRVFTVPSYVKSSLNKTWQDLRDKHLLTTDFDKLSRVELQAAGETVEFGKNAQNEWQILRPKPMRTDAAQVDELVRRLKDATMDTGAAPGDAKTPEAAFQAGGRVAVVAVTDSTGSQQMEVRRDAAKNYYARSSAMEGTHKIPSSVGETLEKKLEAFRNHKLYDFGWSEVSKLDIQRGGSAVSYQKAGDHWTSGGKQIDAASVQTVIDLLRDLGSTGFVDTGGGEPVLEASVATEGGKRLEKVTIAKQGNQYFAWRLNDLTVYELEPASVEDLQKAIGGIKAAEAAAASGKK